MVPQALAGRPHASAATSTNGHEPGVRRNGFAPVSSYFRWKGFVDIPLAVMLLVILGPVIGLLWVLVKITSPGPGFYRQQRAGQFGQPFVMFKLRSMRQDAEAKTGAIWAELDDPRVTRLGHVLRTLHLDELPQLYNVLRGEMSLTGPRPERPEFVEVLAAKVAGYQNRLLVPPGVTGLAQLNLPPDSDLESVTRKLVLDLEYIERAGLWLESRILICTATRLLKLPTLRLLGVNREVKYCAADVHRRAMPTMVDATVVPISQQTAHAFANGNGHSQVASSVHD